MKNFLKPLDFVSGRQLYGSALGASSVVLAKLLYNIELYTDNSMNNYLRNRGAYGTPYNALTYASNHIYHDGVTHSTPCGIVHTLAADSKKLATSVDAGWVDNLDNTYTGTAVTGDIVGISTDTSGVVKVTITLSSVTGGDVNGYTANGTYVFEETLTASLNLTGTGFTGIVTVVSIEAITLPAASYFHYYDTASKSIKQLSSTGDVGEELVTNGNFDTDTDWSYDSAYWRIISGYAEKFDIGSTGLRENIALKPFRYYLITFDISDLSGGTPSVFFGGPFRTVAIITSNGSYSIKASSLSASFSGIEFVGNLALFKVDNVSVKEVLSVSTEYNLTSSYQYAIASTAPLTAADTSYIDANPEAMYRVLYDSLVLPSGFSSTDITHFYDGTMGTKWGALVPDLATPNVYTIGDAGDTGFGVAAISDIPTCWVYKTFRTR